MCLHTFNQLHLLLTNQTSIELKEKENDAVEGHYSNKYDLGWRQNVEQVMGNIWLCMLPMSFDEKTAGDGAGFQTRAKYN
jgi:hypothetical protein